jgi:hypothetical protein
MPGRLLDLGDLGEALEIGLVEALREQGRVVACAGLLESRTMLLGKGAVGVLRGDAVVMGLERRPGGAADMRGIAADDFENGGIDLEGPQPGFDLITERHLREDPEGQPARR